MTVPITILVADDDARDLQMTLLALARQGYKDNIAVAVDGAEALDFLLCRGKYRDRERDNPAFILLDFKMPKVNGAEVLRQIRAVPQLALVPVVMFTSSRERADVLMCYQFGANSYVVKPTDFQEFMATLGGVAAYWITLNEPPPVRPVPAERGKPLVPPPVPPGSRPPSLPEPLPVDAAALEANAQEFRAAAG